MSGPSKTPITDRLLALPPPDRPAGLREELAMAYHQTRPNNAAPEFDMAYALLRVDEMLTNLRQRGKLAALLASEPTGLDVERLARALSNAAEARQPTISADYRAKAQKVAAEYAALAAPSDPVKR